MYVAVSARDPWASTESRNPHLSFLDEISEDAMSQGSSEVPSDYACDSAGPSGVSHGKRERDELRTSAESRKARRSETRPRKGTADRVIES